MTVVPGGNLDNSRRIASASVQATAPATMMRMPSLPLCLAVIHQFRDLLYPLPANTLPLLHCQRMIGRYQFDEGPLTDRASVNHRLEINRVRVAGQCSAEPAKVRGFRLTARLLPQFAGPGEVLGAQRH